MSFENGSQSETRLLSYSYKILVKSTNAFEAAQFTFRKLQQDMKIGESISIVW